jgi:hypothetical protein
MANIGNKKKKLLKKGGTHESVVKQQSYCLFGAKEGEIWGRQMQQRTTEGEKKTHLYQYMRRTKGGGRG